MTHWKQNTTEKQQHLSHPSEKLSQTYSAVSWWIIITPVVGIKKPWVTDLIVISESLISISLPTVITEPNNVLILAVVTLTTEEECLRMMWWDFQYVTSYFSIFDQMQDGEMVARRIKIIHAQSKNAACMLSIAFSWEFIKGAEPVSVRGTC